MDSKIVFLDIVIFLTFLILILSNIFLDGLFDPFIILILLLVYVISYGFIYKFRNFQKVLFILSICSFLFFMSLYGYWSYSHIPLLIIFNWYVIWLIFKYDEKVNDKFVEENQFVLIGFIFYLVFSLILIFSDGGFALSAGTVVAHMETDILEIIGICLLSFSVICLIVFVAKISYSKHSSLSYDDYDRFGK
jgi:hypothetical protein